MRRIRSLLTQFLTGVLVYFVLARPVPALAQTQAAEPDLKAAIILNMLLFVDWPALNARPTDQLTVCYQGSGAVATALVKLDGKTVKGKTLKVVPLGSANAAECLALYITPGTTAIEKILSQFGSLPTLITSDSPDYFQHGVMLNLELVGGRIVFDIDLRSAQKAGLQVSSKALHLARQVIE